MKRRLRRVVAVLLIGMVLSVTLGAEMPGQFNLVNADCLKSAGNGTVTGQTFTTSDRNERDNASDTKNGTSQSCVVKNATRETLKANETSTEWTPEQLARASKVNAHTEPKKPVEPMPEREHPKAAVPAPTPTPTPEPTIAPPVETPVPPTPTPMPATTQSGDGSVASMIEEIFGPYADSAKRIAMCESSMNPNATNAVSINGSHAAGVFQILYPSTWNTTSQAALSPYNAYANIMAAHDIFVRDGYSWREWSCQ